MEEVINEKAFKQISIIAALTRQQIETIATKYVKSHYLGNNLLLCKILSRYKIYLDSRDVGVTPNILMDGYWESWITKFIAKKVKQGDVCVDAGANFGYFSLLMAELAGKDGKTIAVEPNAYLCRLLSFSSTVNEHHFDIVQKALSDKEEELTLFIPADFWGGGTIRTEKVDDNIITQKVQTVTFDSMIAQAGLSKVDFIKMDCEGVEPQIFGGMQKTLQQNPQLKMVMEYSPFMYQDAQGFTEFLFSKFNVGEVTGVSEVQKFTPQDTGHLLNLSTHIDLFLEQKQ